MKKWFEDNKVVLIGMLAAALIVLQQFLDQPNVDWKVVGFGVAIAVLSVLAKNLRGQWVTIITSLSTSLGIVLQSIQSGNNVSWLQVIVSFAITILGVVAPPAKSLSYETSPAIKDAKIEAAVYDKKVKDVSPLLTKKP